MVIPKPVRDELTRFASNFKVVQIDHWNHPGLGYFRTMGLSQNT